MNIFKDFFYLQRNDRQALLALISVVIICILLVHFTGNGNEEETITVAKDSTSLREASENHPLYYKEEGSIHELFPFDPNEADSTQLLRLGLKPWQVRSIYHYRAKGGIYSKPSDFARLYGLSKRQYETLAPFIRIGDDYRPAAEFYGKESYRQKNNEREACQEKDIRHTDTTSGTSKPIYHYSHKLNPGEHIALNSADTTALKRIPGIGTYYARAIVRYRERLGGFVSCQQLDEIAGVPVSAKEYVTTDPQAIRHLNINKLTLNQLCKHPYINFYQAKAICDYRRLNGPIHSLQELKLLEDFPPAAIERLEPYISFN